MNKVYDIERLIGKISYGNANGRDLISLRNSLQNVPDLKKILQNAESELLNNLKSVKNETLIINAVAPESALEISCNFEEPVSIDEEDKFNLYVQNGTSLSFGRSQQLCIGSAGVYSRKIY